MTERDDHAGDKNQAKRHCIRKATEDDQRAMDEINRCAWSGGWIGLDVR